MADTPAQPRLSVLVVVHHSADVLPRCIEGIDANAGIEGGLECIVVDNGSTPPQPRLPGIDLLLRNEHNPGFAVACNQAAAAARGDWLLFLNPDCFLAPGQLIELLGLATDKPGLGLLGAQLLEADGRPQAASLRRDPTPARLLQGLLRGRSTVELSAPAQGEVIEAEAVSGALMLMPRAAFEAVGGFDEGYRLHFEDLDLCRRLRAAGFGVGFAPGVRVVHLKGSSSRRRPLWVAWQKHRGLLRYFRRFDAPALRWPWRLGYRLLLALALPLLLLRALLPVRSGTRA